MKNRYLLVALAVIPLLVGCGESEGNDIVHNQGKNCLSCHSGGEHSFTSGVTIYKSIDGADYDSNDVYDVYNVQLLLDNGQVITYSKGNGLGNKKYSGSITNKFTSQVVDASGSVVNSSNTNSHDASRVACNSCHTSSGANGAPGRVVGFRF